MQQKTIKTYQFQKAIDRTKVMTAITNYLRTKRGKSIRIPEKTICYTHPEYELTYDMMLGIRQTVEAAESAPVKDVNDADLKQENRYVFPQIGSEVTPEHIMDDFFLQRLCARSFS